MPRCNWSAVLAVIGLALTASAYAQSQPPPRPKPDQAAASQTVTEPNKAGPNKAPPPADIAESAKQPVPAEKADAKEQGYAKEDLEAQLRMADAAEGMLIPAWLQFGIGVAGLILLGLTVHYAKRAAEEAKRAADEGERAANAAETMLEDERKRAGYASEDAKRQLRAYLSVEPAGIMQMVMSDQAIGQVSVKNVGKLPANNVFVEVRMKFANDREADFPVPDLPTVPVNRSIQPSAHMEQGSKETLLCADIETRGRYIYVWGIAHYDDGFKIRRKTH